MEPPHHTPLALVERLIAALNRGDLDTALACYAKDAVFIPQPGTTVTGLPAIREALAQFIVLKPVLRSRSHLVLATAATALYCSEWTMDATGPDGNPLTLGGKSSDVFSRQPDGSWLIAIDNPFGTGLLPAASAHTVASPA